MQICTQRKKFVMNRYNMQNHALVTTYITARTDRGQLLNLVISVQSVSSEDTIVTCCCGFVFQHYIVQTCLRC